MCHRDLRKKRPAVYMWRVALRLASCVLDPRYLHCCSFVTYAICHELN